MTDTTQIKAKIVELHQFLNDYGVIGYDLFALVNTAMEVYELNANHVKHGVQVEYWSRGF